MTANLKDVREALRPFAELPEAADTSHMPTTFVKVRVQYYQLRRAAAVLSQMETPAPQSGGSPVGVPQFDAMVPEQEELAVKFCAEIAGPRGKKGSPPDPARLLEMAEALYKAEMRDSVSKDSLLTDACTCGHPLKEHDGPSSGACGLCLCMYFEAKTSTGKDYLQVAISPQPLDGVTVPQWALDWLFGAGPDKSGRHFDRDAYPDARGAFWWRSKFRKMIDSASKEET